MTKPQLPQSRELLQGLFEIGQAISQIQDPEELLQRVMDVAVETVGAERGFLVLREGPEKVRVAAYHNISEEGAARIGRPPRSIVNRVLECGRPVLSTDAAVDLRFRAAESVINAPVRAVACVPLIVRAQVQGAIYVDSLTGSGRFNQETLLFLAAFASQAGTALENARLYATLREENRQLREQLRSEYDFSEIVGNSPALREVFEILPEVSASNATVLIEGESGTGKELVARAIHQNSPRRHRPFVTVFCSSLAENLLESELFGHRRGAFTGAHENKIGLFEAANHGTLFLDEVGEIGPQVQVKLLRFMESGEFRRVGETQLRYSDVRVIAATKAVWWVIVAGVVVLLGLYLFVQYGPGEMKTIWLFMEGREYIEAPRWVHLALVLWMGTFLFNVIATVLASRRVTGLLAVLIFDLVALGALYTAGMHYTVNITMDQYLWWWVVHLWVEGTWEVVVGVLVAWSLMYLLGTSRRIVETWLFVEVALVFGTGILGLGHHYFWIGTPEYWLGLGGFFSALEPIPLVAMVVHAVYDAGSHRLSTVNKPAMFWVITQAFGNFIGAGVWGFMQTLPQINMYSHGTQLAAAHGHLAFFGAYVAIDLALVYIAAQHLRKTISIPLDSKLWRWAAGLMILGIVGVTAAFTLSGFMQTLVERAVGGSTWAAFIDSYTHPWYAGTLSWRFAFGLIMFLGYALLGWDLLTLGKAKQGRRAG